MAYSPRSICRMHKQQSSDKDPTHPVPRKAIRAISFQGRRRLVALSPLERWTKLKEMMSANSEQPYGRSTNAVSQEAGVYLTTLNDFLKSGGAPTKYDAEMREYRTKPLQKLAEWIDDHPSEDGRLKASEAVNEFKQQKPGYHIGYPSPGARSKEIASVSNQSIDF
mmetsp:Transcript_85905/g.171946  ORF Transcript_85905/g.171946 Transcript_85905/m.171946 type:complete len:166 (+) Transcript_85905:103-600(+)|eukprot:CAMPEP_0171711694 /NCGR_PEP_ID=MMETSP0991-20121206/16732_1 /TAXON_ID=483369 /ORGANISM="non described non described, Strain CCMP2098" /LENGTH=165 /DNA_ID=CAMNT_0012302053 /DNA_START=89 /DNA_END=586 /DNA_ORIENTATION=-